MSAKVLSNYTKSAGKHHGTTKCPI